VTSPSSSVPDQIGGPLVAVCGVCGGAGASTLAYLIACSAVAGGAQAGAAPVLLGDANPATAGLSLYAGAESRYSLDELGDQLAAGQLDGESMIVRTTDGVRLIATGPRQRADGNPGAIARILRDASQTHALTVIDCGTLAGGTGRHVLSLATHVLWVVPATDVGVMYAQRALAAVPARLDGAEVLVARRDVLGRRAPTRALTRLADGRRAPLVLVPHVEDLIEAPVQVALDACEVALAGLSTTLRR
jgi:cellulose biosynthesis protein BcsQ